MTGHQHGRVLERVKLPEPLDDDATRVGLVIRSDFSGCEQACARHVAIPVVGLRRAVGRQAFFRLGPGGGVEAVGVGDATDSLEGAV